MRKMHNKKIGDPSSEYGMPNGGERFAEAVQKKQDRAALLWADFIGFMKDHDVTPAELRAMFTRYYEEFLK